MEGKHKMGATQERVYVEAQGHEQGGDVEAQKVDDWEEGRGVIRRPEVRNSILEDSYIIRSSEESRKLSATVIESVTRRSQLSDEQLAEARADVAAVAAKLGIDMEATE